MGHQSRCTCLEPHDVPVRTHTETSSRQVDVLAQFLGKRSIEVRDEVDLLKEKHGQRQKVKAPQLAAVPPVSRSPDSSSRRSRPQGR